MLLSLSFRHFTQNQNVHLQLAFEVTPGDHQSHEDSSSGNHECKKFHGSSCGGISVPPTITSVPRATLLAWLKMERSMKPALMLTQRVVYTQGKSYSIILGHDTSVISCFHSQGLQACCSNRGYSEGGVNAASNRRKRLTPQNRCEPGNHWIPLYRPSLSLAEDSGRRKRRRVRKQPWRGREPGHCLVSLSPFLSLCLPLCRLLASVLPPPALPPPPRSPAAGR